LGALSQAIFCLEEVLLHQPGNVSVQLLLADTLYSAGGPANLRAARGYYSAAIEATEGSNVKALYGVCACVAQLAGAGKRGASGSKATADADEEGEAVAEVAGEELLARHARLAPDKLSMVKGMLKAQRLLR
jgi:ER membrane protein complex subunit 2